MSEGSKIRQRPTSIVSRKGQPAPTRGTISAEVNTPSGYKEPTNVIRNRKIRVLSELPKNQVKQCALKLNHSKSNSDLFKGANEALGGKILSCENVSRIVKLSKIPRATYARQGSGESFNRSVAANDGKTVKRPDRIPLDDIDSKENASTPGISNADLPSPALTDEYLGKSESCDSKRSSGDFDDSLGPISDDEIIDISGDITIRKEALDIAVKLASRTPTDIEESSALGFSELAMLDILGASDLNLNVPKNELSFTIFEEMDTIADTSSRPPLMDIPMECSDSTVTEMEPVASARSPSPIEELPLSSRTPNAPVSIITSITSIMSLDTGYQGDGELSRPESRSAEVDSRLKIPHIESGVQVKSIQFDDSKTMTDSDFFTESDADIHDDLSAAAAEIGSGKGDRKAQVIDGTLYGGAHGIHKNGYTQSDGDNRGHENVNAPFVSNSSNDDMASSGVFSDVEKKPEDGFSCSNDTEAAHESEAMEDCKREEERKARPEVNEGMVKSSSAESSSTIQEIAPTVARTSSDASVQENAQKWTPSTKNKMPNRNVTSKVKVLIESSKTKTETRPKTVRKGKWDAVMDRIAQGKEENKYTPTRFRDVKSKVYQSTKPLFNSKCDEVDNKTTPNNLQSKARSRRNVRVRSSDSPLVLTKTARKSTSPNSSQRSSISDISVSAVNKQKLINESNQNGVPAKSASTSIIGPVTNNNNNNINNKHKAKTIKMVQKKSSPMPTRSKDIAQQKSGPIQTRVEDKTAGLLKQLKHNNKAFESFAILLRYCIDDLEAFSTPHLKEKLEKERVKYAESQSRLMEVEYHLQEQLHNKMKIINDLENENKNLIQRIEEFRSLADDLKQEESELKEKLNTLEEELETKEREKEEIEEELKRENKDLGYRIEEVNKMYAVLKKMYDKTKLELVTAKEVNSKHDIRQKLVTENSRGDFMKNGSYGRDDGVPDRLESEVESLRQVLALKTDEVSELRRQELILRENADRVPKLVSTITLLEGKVEDFHSQLSSQTEANRELEKRNYNLEEELKLTNVQKLRLTQKNEELQYKLRQYAEALRQLVSEKNLTEDDIRNVYLYPKTPQKGDCNVIVDSLPAQMKGVVQKSDSVSYMLEMTEDSSEIVTNIIRRAESMRYASRSQTLPKKKRPKTYSVSSVDALPPYEDYLSGNKPCASSPKYPFHKVYDMQVTSTPKNKIVKLQPNDFIPDALELTGDDRCEIIEITKNFDRAVKGEDMNEMSYSSCSSSSENGNNFDIESDIYTNAHESDESRTDKEADLRVGSNYESGEDVLQDEDEKKGAFSDFGNVPKTSGGEALIISSDDTRSSSP